MAQQRKDHWWNSGWIGYAFSASNLPFVSKNSRSTLYTRFCFLCPHSWSIDDCFASNKWNHQWILMMMIQVKMDHRKEIFTILQTQMLKVSGLLTLNKAFKKLLPFIHLVVDVKLYFLMKVKCMDAMSL